MLAVESERVWSKSPEYTAADLGTALPFNHAEPAVYNIADAASSPSICAGNEKASKQHKADRSADVDVDMTEKDSRMFEINFIVRG